jgi:hypothetical protein
VRVAVALTGAMLVCVSQPARSQEWTTFVAPQFGTRLELPSKVFAVHDGPAPRGIGEQYKTTDGRAVLAVYSQPNVGHETPRTYLRRNYRVSQATLDYVRVSRSFFAVSAVHEGTIYYSRCSFSRDSGGAIHCFDLKYPAQEKRAWDDIVTRISRSLGPSDRG